MKKQILIMVVSYLAKLLTQGAKEEIKLTLKEAVLNDFENHKLSFISIPIFIFISLHLFGAGLVLLTYGLIDLYVLGNSGAVVALLTSGGVFLLGVVLSLITLTNIKYIIRRVEMMNQTVVNLKGISSPFKRIGDQFKKENKMLLESFMGAQSK